MINNSIEKANISIIISLFSNVLIDSVNLYILLNLKDQMKRKFLKEYQVAPYKREKTFYKIGLVSKSCVFPSPTQTQKSSGYLTAKF